MITLERLAAKHDADWHVFPSRSGDLYIATRRRDLSLGELHSGLSSSLIEADLETLSAKLDEQSAREADIR